MFSVQAPGDDTMIEDTVIQNLPSSKPLSRSLGELDGIVGDSPALKVMLRQVERVAPTETSVLILGETGTGKELVARAIHARSRRASRPFIKVNCAAIPPSLIASELFGHEKGAFTGAMQRRLGRFEAANGGTIFLDEVGELPMETQIALLRVLQEREFERVGSNHPVSVDVRIVAATNRDLKAAIGDGTFRSDVFYRLNVFPIRLPALRERAGDIPVLVNYLVDRYSKKVGKQFAEIAKDTLELLQGYHWPGNIRELQNVVERAVILSEGDVFTVDRAWVQQDLSLTAGSTGLLAESMAEQERQLIEAALAESRGRIAGPFGAAARLGVPRQTLDSKIASLQIRKNQFKMQPAN
jgi:formate hydrogenlyase transcriptional activator